jgi:hypothetical protein
MNILSLFIGFLVLLTVVLLLFAGADIASNKRKKGNASEPGTTTDPYDF